jgi:general secretion pathway protein A
MYNDFFGFSEPPFNLTPNSKYFFQSAKHLEALSTLQYAIEHKKGFVVVTGDIGSGKTTVCRTLMNNLDQSRTKTALVTNTRIEGRDLLMTVLEDFEVPFTSESISRLQSHLNEFLIQELRRDNNVVLIIDEAQNLSTSVLEEVRLLSNLETENEKLIQILLLGQPELRQKLSQPVLEQLRQRIAVYFHLTPLDRDDSARYIRHRLHLALVEEKKQDTEHIFNDQAITAIYEFTKGVPRLINQICDSALLTGYVNNTTRIGMDTIQEVIQESPMNQICDDPNQPIKTFERSN